MKRILTIILISLFFASCTNESKEIVGSKKNELRIVSLAPSVTKEIINLGLGDSIIGCTNYCILAKDNNDLIIGNAIKVNIEKILLLKPTIVFATGLTTKSAIRTLRQNGIDVHCVKKQESFDVICEQFIELGKLLQRDSVAQQIVSRSKTKVDSLINTVPIMEKKPNVFLQIGCKPIFTVIPNTFMNDYITYAGCENIASDMIHGTITRETVLKRNPDIIIITTMGGFDIVEKENWERYKDMEAVKNKRIFIIDSIMSNTPTVLSFVETLELIISNIYPKN